jgi:multidrug efflux pump subunit AcrA (membrane-fusion protein)
VKKTIFLLVFIFVVVDAGILWIIEGNKHEPKEEARAEEEGPKVSRDSNGNAVIEMSDEVQGDLGIQVTNPPAFQLSPEIKGYGRVFDPAPLAALMNELATARTAEVASSNELARLKILEAQGNAAARAVQAAEAAALRDQLAVQSDKERLVLSWGKALSELKELPELSKTLASLDSTLVRIDLPIGQKLKEPAGARIESLANVGCDAEYLGLVPSVDSQMQGRGFLFLVRSNTSQLAPGEAVVGYLKVPGEPLHGVLVPRQAVVRNEGSGWVYVLNSGTGEAFTRTQIPLDRAVEGGWFVGEGLTATNYIVIDGAQQLLSIEQHGGGEPE